MRPPIKRMTPKAAFAAAATLTILASSAVAAGTAQAAIPLIPCHDTAELIQQIKVLDQSHSAGQIYLAKNCAYEVTEPAVFDQEGNDGLPEVSGQITIVGQNSTIDRAETAPRFRLFHVDPGASLTLKGINLTRGMTIDHTGAAIDDFGHVTLTDTNIIGNDAGLGGGLFIGRDAAATITGGSFKINGARDSGGAINDMGTLVDDGTLFEGNGAVTQGGGVQISGTTTLTNVSMDHNSAGGGGGAIAISGDGGLGLSGNSRLTENLTLTGPGAISNASAATPHISSTVIIRDNMPTDCAGSPMAVSC